MAKDVDYLFVCPLGVPHGKDVDYLFVCPLGVPHGKDVDYLFVGPLGTCLYAPQVSHGKDYLFIC